MLPISTTIAKRKGRFPYLVLALFPYALWTQANDTLDSSRTTLSQQVQVQMQPQAQEQAQNQMQKKNLHISFPISFQTHFLLPTAASRQEYQLNNRLLNNSYLDVRLESKHLSAGARFEYMPAPLLGYEQSFAGKGLPYFYVQGKIANADLTLGGLYETWGSGFILRSYENRDLGIDNHLLGARITWRPLPTLQLKALTGRQRNYWHYNAAQITGVDAEWQAASLLPHWQATQRHLSLEISWVNKHEAQEEVLLNSAYRLRLPSYVNAFDMRLHYTTPQLTLHAEYAHKTQDPSLANNYIYRNGQVALISASYARKGMSFLLQTQRSVNMDFRSERSGSGLAGQLNHFPPFTLEHSYRLARLYPYATQLQGEWAWQAAWGYHIPRHSLLGGKYGRDIKVNFSHIRDIARKGESERGTEGYTAPFWQWGKDLFYQEVSVGIDQRLTRQTRLNFLYLHQSYDPRLIEGKGNWLRSHIFIADMSHRLNRKWAWRGELQYLAAQGTGTDWACYLLECNYGKHWTLSAQQLFALNSSHAHYYQCQLGYRHDAGQWTVGYGRTREGYYCTGGVCRYVPAYEGATFSYLYHF